TYARMQGAKDLDALLSHFMPFEDEAKGEGRVVSMPSDVGVLYAQEQLHKNGVIVSGHIHGARTGKTNFGYTNMRGQATILEKRGDGKVTATPLWDTFQENEEPYDVEDFKKRL